MAKTIRGNTVFPKWPKIKGFIMKIKMSYRSSEMAKWLNQVGQLAGLKFPLGPYFSPYFSKSNKRLQFLAKAFILSCFQKLLHYP